MKALGKILPALLALGLALGATAAQAIATTDVTFRILPGDYEPATAAELLTGNDNVSLVNTLAGDFAGDPWALLDKTDESATPFEGVVFAVTADIDGSSGNWGLSWSGAGLPVTMDLLVVTKAARNWGAYLFEALEFGLSPGSGDGTFDISWLNNGGQIPGLSHVSVYGRPAEPGDPDTPPLPVPGSLLLVSLGLGLLRYASSKM